MDGRGRIIGGDCLGVLKTLPAESVNCCVTSPPYWGLRNYNCDEQIGLEETPEAYVARLVEVFREVRRVLADDGTLWLNLGDSYNAAGRAGYRDGHGKDPKSAAVGPMTQPNRMPIAGLKPKDLVGIPWRVAFALQADGWYLRQDIIWHKPNPMPESVRDRCTKAHEYLFMLSKAPRYYYDADAVAEPAIGRTPHDLTGPGYNAPGQSAQRGNRKNPKFGGTKYPGVAGKVTYSGNEYRPSGSRNKRDVWTVATKPYPEAHFATFPPDLIRPCIRAGCPPGGTVLDPFAGAGTTGLVALEEGRDFLGIELNPDYCKMAEKRIVGLAMVRPLSTFFEGGTDERQANEA